MLMEGSREEKAAKHCLTPQKEKALVNQVVTFARNLNLFGKNDFAVSNAIFPPHGSSIDQHLDHFFVTFL
jgi:hypothetical protein